MGTRGLGWWPLVKTGLSVGRIMPWWTAAILAGMSATIHTTDTRMWLKRVRVARINCKRIVCGACPMYARRFLIIVCILH